MAATGIRYYTPNAFEIDGNGVPIVGAQLFFYLTGTSTPLNTYSDVALTIPNPNPVVAVANGYYGNIFLSQTQAYKVVCYGPNPTPSIPSTPASPQGTQLWSADPVGPAASALVQASPGIIGEIRQFAGTFDQIPSQWYPCYGQSVSRSTYAAAYAVMGTAWGPGDGSTTFTLPDLRGRVLAGLDNMGPGPTGNTPANRMTAGVSGVAGTTLGGVGGDQHAQTDTLTAATTCTVTDPTHSHTFATGWSYDNNSGGGTQAPAQLGQGPNGSYHTDVSATGITVAATTSVTSGLTGASQNVQPTAMVYSIIYLGA